MAGEFIVKNGLIVSGSTLVSGSVIATSFTGSFSGSFAGVGASDRITTGSVTASLNVSGNVLTLNSASSTLLTVSQAGLLTVSNSINIGVPADGAYNTGFFDTFTSNTKLSDALDEISAAFLDLAPAKSAILTGTSLSRTNPTIFTGNLAGGLTSTDWYATASAFSQYTTLTAATNVDLRANGTRAGKSSDISASLVGGVTSSRAYGTAAFTPASSRSLASGVGTTGTVTVSGINTFNTFWAQVTSSTTDTINRTGSVQYRISADNGAGQTNAFQLFYVGGAGDFPSQTVSTPVSVTSSTTLNYLSGIPYLRTATFTVGFTGSNLFNPVYNLNQISYTSNFFATLTTGSNTPNATDTLLLNVTRSLNASTHSGIIAPTATLTATKPNKSNATSVFNLSTSRVNSYTAAVSTNNANSQTDVFVDEAQRYTNLNTVGWASGSALVDGNLQIQNNILIAGRWGDYAAFTSGSTAASTTYANYFRNSVPGTTNRIGGTFTIIRNTNAFAASTPISAWGSGGRLEVALILKADVTGAETANFYYDLGRAVGANSGTIIGIRNTITTNNTATYVVTWALPGGVSTGANGAVLWIRYRNTPASDFITSLSITYN
jgi:hypothetical protein